MIALTDAAQFAATELCRLDPEGRSLRIFVQHKGCTGLTFGFGLDEPLAVDSAWIEGDATFLVTTALATLIRGATLDYVTGQEEEPAPTLSGFRLQLPEPERFKGKFFKHRRGGELSWDQI